jgi:hypothetical protein
VGIGIEPYVGDARHPVFDVLIRYQTKGLLF